MYLSSISHLDLCIPFRNKCWKEKTFSIWYLWNNVRRMSDQKAFRSKMHVFRLQDLFQAYKRRLTEWAVYWYQVMTGDSELRMTIDTLLYTAEISELITGYVCIRFSLLLLLLPSLPTFPPSLESYRFSVHRWQMSHRNYSSDLLHILAVWLLVSS